MRAYYFDNLPGDQRLPHDCVPSRPVTAEHLEQLGVLPFHIPVTDGYEHRIDAIAKERDYKNRDVINISKAGLGDAYEDKIKMFFTEHLHEDEEIRYVVNGSGFFDIRETPSESWIRVAVGPGDLLVLPAGIYHRFTLDESNQVEAMRLFKDEPKWAALNRGSDTELNLHRVEYLRSISQVA